MPSQLGKCAVDKDILSGIGHVVTNEKALCVVQQADGATNFDPI